MIKNHKISGLINGPISKKHFLKKKFQGITEFLANYYKVKSNYAMLIYSRSLSVLPVTTHYPIKIISSKIDKKSIIIKAILVNNFYKKVFSIKPKIAVCGLNPHCENFFTKSEENEKINPAIDYLKNKNLSIKGPFPADTIFMKHLRKNFDVIIGMYHDQVLTPMKALAGFDAINITLGLPFIRISPDHGPNNKMLGKNESDPSSIFCAMKFINKI